MPIALNSSRARMPITFHPKVGTVLMCDFSTGFKAPEMVKIRPVVVVSRKHSQIAIVVPLSTVEPIPFEACHVEMSTDSLPKSLRHERCWAKCDMVSHVALSRLDRIMDGKCPTTGKRLYVAPQITSVDLELIRDALRHVLYL
jgi:mRNA interferase MazF